MPQKNKKRFDSSLIKTTKKQYKKTPDSNIELEPWTKFVQSQGLMEYKDGEYIITNKGLAFMLTWHFSIMKIGYGKKIGATGLEPVTYGLTG